MSTGRITLGEPILGGRQGVASGLPSAMPTGASWGTWGQADATLVSGAVALYPAVETITATVTIPLAWGTLAAGTPRGQAAASALVTVQTAASGTARNVGTAAADLVLTATSTATPKVAAAASVLLRLTAEGASRTRVTAAALVPLTWRTASSVILTIRAAVSLVLRLITRGRTTQPSTRIRARDLSGPAYEVIDQSEGWP